MNISETFFHLSVYCSEFYTCACEKSFYFVASRCDWNWVRSRVKTLLIKHSPTWNKEMCITGTKCLAEETRVTVDKVLIKFQPPYNLFL